MSEIAKLEYTVWIDEYKKKSQENDKIINIKQFLDFIDEEYFSDKFHQDYFIDVIFTCLNDSYLKFLKSEITVFIFDKRKI